MIDTRLLLSAAAALVALPALSWVGIPPAEEGPLAVERPPMAVHAAEIEAAPSLRAAPVPRTPIAARTALESPEERYPAVETARPSVRIDDFDGSSLEQVREIGGIRYATSVELGKVSVVEDGGEDGEDGSEVDLALVDPSELRLLVPQVTADSAPLWERIDEGELAFTHERARELELDLGGHVLVGAEEPARMRVGAFASNGTPPIADVVLSRHGSDGLELSDRSRSVLIAVEDGTSPDEVAYRLRRIVDGEVSVVPDPRAGRDLTPQEQSDAPTVWDALAMCESSGDWHINTGNGYYGGLQFLPESWWMVGGTGMPHEATREEQIHRAERLLRIQGWRAWPACSSKLGLR